MTVYLIEIGKEVIGYTAEQLQQLIVELRKTGIADFIALAGKAEKALTERERQN